MDVGVLECPPTAPAGTIDMAFSSIAAAVLSCGANLCQHDIFGDIVNPNLHARQEAERSQEIWVTISEWPSRVDSTARQTEHMLIIIFPPAPG